MVRLLLMVVLSLAVPVVVVAQPTDKPAKLLAMLSKLHVQPRPANEVYTRQVLQLWMQAADPYQLYFDASMAKRLQTQVNHLPTATPQQAGVLLDSLTQYFHTARQSLATLAREVLAKPLDYNKTAQYLTVGSQPANWPANAATLQARRLQYFTWSILDMLYKKWEEKTGEDSPKAPVMAVPAITDAWFKEQEPMCRAAVQKRLLTNLQRGSNQWQELRQTVEKDWLNAMAEAFDPHSNYFSEAEQKAFESSLSAERELFGFQLNEAEEGVLQVESLVPGSPAWNSGQIFKGDVLVKLVLADGKTLLVETEGVAAIMEALGSAGKAMVSFTFKSADGKEKQINLRREAVSNEENLVRGYLLQGPRKLGYIALPSFFGEASGEGTGSANALSKELIKLKREKIEGLILDLRYNGGGSMAEAAALAGVFIDLGPISLIKYGDNTREVVKDPSRGLIYDGPLTVLINGQSASASELVAGVLQDYKRATIVGSTSFGKGTMQMVLPLDSSLPASMDKLYAALYRIKGTPTDFVKVTTGKFYRITGSTNQFGGIVPDVWLPDAFEAAEYTERELVAALPADTVVSHASYTPWPHPPQMPPLATTVGQEPFFKAVKQWTQTQKSKRQLKNIPLNWQAFAAWSLQTTAPDGADEPYRNETLSFTPHNTSYTEKLLSLDTPYSQYLNNQKIDALKTDRYVDAAYRLMLQQLQ